MLLWSEHSNGQGTLGGGQAGLRHPEPPHHSVQELPGPWHWGQPQQWWPSQKTDWGWDGTWGQGCGDLGTGPAAASLGQGLTMGSWAGQVEAPGESGSLKSISVLRTMRPSKNNPDFTVLQNQCTAYITAQNTLQKYHPFLLKQTQAELQVPRKGNKMLCLLLNLIFFLDLHALSFGRSLLWKMFYYIGS